MSNKIVILEFGENPSNKKKLPKPVWGTDPKKSKGRYGVPVPDGEGDGGSIRVGPVDPNEQDPTGTPDGDGQRGGTKETPSITPADQEGTGENDASDAQGRGEAGQAPEGEGDSEQASGSEGDAEEGSGVSDEDTEDIEYDEELMKHFRKIAEKELFVMKKGRVIPKNAWKEIIESTLKNNKYKKFNSAELKSKTEYLLNLVDLGAHKTSAGDRPTFPELAEEATNDVILRYGKTTNRAAAVRLWSELLFWASSDGRGRVASFDGLAINKDGSLTQEWMDLAEKEIGGDLLEDTEVEIAGFNRLVEGRKKYFEEGDFILAALTSLAMVQEYASIKEGISYKLVIGLMGPRFKNNINKLNNVARKGIKRSGGGIDNNRYRIPYKYKFVNIKGETQAQRIIGNFFAMWAKVQERIEKLAARRTEIMRQVEDIENKKDNDNYQEFKKINETLSMVSEDYNQFLSDFTDPGVLGMRGYSGFTLYSPEADPADIKKYSNKTQVPAASIPVGAANIGGAQTLLNSFNFPGDTKQKSLFDIYIGDDATRVRNEYVQSIVDELKREEEEKEQNQQNEVFITKGKHYMSKSDIKSLIKEAFAETDTIYGKYRSSRHHLQSPTEDVLPDKQKSMIEWKNLCDRISGDPTKMKAVEFCKVLIKDPELMQDILEVITSKPELATIIMNKMLENDGPLQ